MSYRYYKKTSLYTFKERFCKSSLLVDVLDNLRILTPNPSTPKHIHKIHGKFDTVQDVKQLNNIKF